MALEAHPVPARRQSEVLLAREKAREDGNEPDLPSIDGLPPVSGDARDDVEAVVVDPELELDRRLVAELRTQRQGVRLALGAHAPVRPEIPGIGHRQDTELVRTHGSPGQRKLFPFGAVPVRSAGRFDAVLKQGERVQYRRLAAVVGADQHGHVVEIDDRLVLEALEALDGEAADHGQPPNTLAISSLTCRMSRPLLTESSVVTRTASASSCSSTGWTPCSRYQASFLSQAMR